MAHLAKVARLPAPCFTYFRRSGGIAARTRVAASPKGNYDWSQIDRVDAEQAVDIRRLIACVQELQDKVEKLEGELSQGERRDHDHMVATKALIKEALAAAGVVARAGAAGASARLAAELEDDVDVAEAEAAGRKWDSYRNSFTLLMSRGYLQTVEQLRDTLMASEWELGLRPMAMQIGVARFEEYCASQNADVPFEALSALYEDPTTLEVIEDVQLRLRARACIAAAEAEQRVECFRACTAEAQKLASQFTEGEFISKLLPDPIEHGLVDSISKLLIPMTRLMK